jgi:hypothetical protein
MEHNFQQKQQEEQQTTAASETKSEVTFASTEEMIRADIAENPPPPEIAERLNESIANEPKKSASFWEKLGFRK